MTVEGARPPRAATAGLGSQAATPQACHHREARPVRPWTGAPGTTGSVAVVGAGKMGLTLVGQFLSHGWSVTAVDVRIDVVESINAGHSHIDEPGLDELVRVGHADGRLQATLDAAAAVHEADVVVLIVPVMLDEAGEPDRSLMDAAVGSILPGIHADQLVVFETTLPIGDTRQRYVPMLEAASGLKVDESLFVAFSPERLYSGDALRNLATYPKLVGSVGPRSLDRAAAFYESVLDAPVTRMASAEAAEFAKLAETTYRDVNIALANEFAAVAAQYDLDVREVIAGANSQPYSHIHQPGLGVGGHCIPVYPRFLLAGSTDLPLIAQARAINDDQVANAVKAVAEEIGDLHGQPVLVLGVTYRTGVRELAYSRGVALVRALVAAGANVYAYDPLLGEAEVVALGATQWSWGSQLPVRALLTQTDDPAWRSIELGWFPSLALLVDGRNSLVDFDLPPGVEYLGVGVPRRPARD